MRSIGSSSAERRPRAFRRPLLQRATALALSWIFTATTFWSMAPPLASAAPLAEGTPVTAAVRPVLECVVENGPNQFTAHFGYANENSVAVTIAAGANNKFTPSPQDRGQPRIFQPGRTPYYPNAAFSVPFDGNNLVWTLKGPDGSGRTSMASRSSARCQAPPPPVSACDTTFFGPRRYTRTNGAPDVFDETLPVPAWAVSPYVLRVQNGEADGRNRVSSATITVNGAEALHTSDLNQNVAGLERAVVLLPTTALRVVLASSPGSYLTLNLCGTSGDKTPPRIAWTEPAAGAFTNEPTPRLAVVYEDVAGSGEPGASGVDTGTLQVLVDGVDRTALLAARAGDASGEPLEPLAEGTHRLEARIADRAGNVGVATPVDFRVDLTRPTASWMDPAEGSAWRDATVPARVVYADDAAVDPESLRVTLHGTDRTALFSRTASEATAALDDTAGLQPGPNPLVATVKDRAGNESLPATRGFYVDRQPPLVTIAQPLPPGRVGTATPEIVVRYSDDQELVVSSFEAFLDGEGLSPRPLPPDLTVGPEGAQGRTPPLPDGSYTLVARILDRAGNQGEASAFLTVDTTLPDVQVTLPRPGSRTREGSPLVRAEYADTQGVDLATLSVTIDGADATALFLPAGESASEARVAFSDGRHKVVATIEDVTGNAGVGRSDFTVDTTPPEASIELPALATNASSPALRAVYSDATTGVDPATVAAWLDGQEVAGLLAGETEATAVLATDPPLADGEHEIRLDLQDRAENPRSVTKRFRLDTRAPSAEVEAPAPDGFTNDRTPEVRVRYADLEGSGALPGSVRVFLRKLADPPESETELQAVSAGVDEATFVVPDGEALADGTYRVRVSLADAAGNTGSTETAFTVDTAAPRYWIETPTKGQWLGTTTPAFSLRFEDGASGVDPSRFGFAVDGKELGARFTVDSVSAMGVLLPEDALAEGAHAATVTVFDRAGNAGVTSDPMPFPFAVDVTPPTLTVALPVPGSYLGVPADRVKLEYGDGAGSGIVPESVEVTIDGVTPSRDGWTVTPAATEGPLVPPVGDGVHTLVAKVRDGAGNETIVPAEFIVDALPPVVTLTAPDDGSYHKASPVTLTGTVADADPLATVRCLREGAEAPATVSGGSFTCALPLAEGANAVQAEGRDRLAHTGESEPRTLHLDTLPPEIVYTEPTPGSVVAAATVDVRGEVQDASPTKWVRVAGVDAELSGSQFIARGVAVGDGPDVSLAGEAEDAAGNVGQGPLPLVVDRQPPMVEITRPKPDDYVKGPVIDVEGEVSDASETMVEVNGHPEDQPLPQKGHRPFRVRLPVTDAQTIELVATAVDAAGNRGVSPTVPVHVDTAPPVVTITSPPEFSLTKTASVVVAGTVIDISPITSLIVGGIAAAVGPDGSFEIEVPLPEEKSHVLTAVAVDRAGNAGSDGVEVEVDRTPPVVTVTTPGAGVVVGGVPVLVEGTVVEKNLDSLTVNGENATVVGSAWQASVGGLGEGGSTLQVWAGDKAGNVTALPWSVKVDLQPPDVVILSPTGGAVRDPAVTVSGTVRDVSLESLLVNQTSVTWAGDPASPGGASFSLPGVALVDQQENRITVEARDALQRGAAPRVDVFRDSLAPTVALQTPPQVVRGKPGLATATADDHQGVGVATVVFSVNGQEKARLAQPPYELLLEVPDGVASGATLTVIVVAIDRVDNASSPVSRGVVVASEGVVVGHVLADETSRPLAGATVRMVSGGVSGAASTTTDETGRYALPAESASAVLVAESEQRTSVERALPVEAGVGTVPVDARLTPLAPPVSVGPAGGTLALGPAATPPAGAVGLAVSVPQDAFAAEVPLRLTLLSSQGLPNLLPLGFSEVLAFDLRADGGATPGAALEATVSGLDAAAGPLHLVAYRTTAHAWVMVLPGLTPVAGALTFALPRLGAYALVASDPADPAVVIPEADALLVGVEMAAIPATATSDGVVEPAVLPPSGGAAEGTLRLASPLPLPSGTVVQAEVTETYTLASGDVASEEKRSHDIVLSRGPVVHVERDVPSLPDEPAEPTTARFSPCTAAEVGQTALCAAFPITPARAFETAELVEGKVHLDILAGREGVRGKVGGSQAVKVESVGGEASVLVPAQALGWDTAIAVETSALSSFLPSSGGVVALAEVVVDFSGQTLGLGAELSVLSPGVATGDTLVVARVERVDGIPRLEVVSLARVETDGGGVERLVSEPIAGLPGVVKGGRYVFYRLGGPVGFVKGRVLQVGSGVAGAVVGTSGLPFVGVSVWTGAYAVAVVPGAVTLTATKPRTSLAGQAGPITVEAVPAGAAGQDIVLEGTVIAAAIVPPDGSKDLPPTQQMEVRSPTPLLAATVLPENVRLYRLEGAQQTAVLVRLLRSGSGRTLAVIPVERLAYEATYRLEATGLKDVFGADVVVSPAVFQTRKEIPPASHPERMTFSFPDERGLVTVSGPGKAEAPPDGTYEAGTDILIINASNGFVLTLQAGNDNEVPATEFPATINDRLMITVTDPFGKQTSFQRSQFVNPDTGETAVGPGGGVVEGPGGVEMRIPEGALDQGAVLKVTGLSPAELYAEVGDERVPNIPGAELGSALRIEAPSKPRFKKEVDLAFPLPAEVLSATGGKPEDAFFYVYRRVEGPGGAVFFQTLDYGQVECPGGATSCSDGEKKVVTASFPFLGFGGVVATWAGVALTTSHAYLMWTFNTLLPGQPTLGTVTGRVLRPTWPDGATSPVYVGVEAKVWGTDGSGLDLVKDPDPLGPAETVAYTDGSGVFTFFDQRFTTGTLVVKAEVEGEEYQGTAYAVQLEDSKNLLPPALVALGEKGWKTRQVATVDITVAPLVEPPPLPAVDVKVMKVEEGERAATDGIVTRGTPLLFGFKSSSLTVRSAQVDGQQLEVVPEDLSGTTAGSPLAMDELGRDRTSADGFFRPERTGRFAVKVVARPRRGDLTQEERFETTFLVVEGTEGNTVTREGEPPAVITARTRPKDNATGVPVSTLPEVAFTEPVKNVPAGIFLEKIAGQGPVPETIPLTLLGVRPNGGIVQVVGPGDVVVSVTLRLQRGLDYQGTYRLRVSGAVEDLDTTPQALQPEYTSVFTTFGPKDLQVQTEKFSSPGLVVLGDHAYVLETAYAGGTVGGEQRGYLRTYDVSDPVDPREVGEKQEIGFPPRDVSGEGATLAVVTGSRMYYRYAGDVRDLVSTPGNLLVYDVSGVTPEWNGAASVARTIVDGHANAVVVKAEMAYVAVARKGIQVVDLAKARANFGASTPSQVTQKMWTPGEGFGLDAVKTIPITDPALPTTAQLQDLAVRDVSWLGQTERFVFGTGTSKALGLVVTDPSRLAVVRQQAVERGGSVLEWGSAIAVGEVLGRSLVVVGGTGKVDGSSGASGLVAIIDLTPMSNWPPPGGPPPQPEVVAFVAVPAIPGDILIHGTTAIVSGWTGTRANGQPGLASLVDLTDPPNARLIGTITGVGSRLALTDSNILFSTDRTFLKTSPTELSGLHATTLSSILLVLDKSEKALSRIKLPRNTDLFVRAIAQGAGETMDVDVSIVDKDNNIRKSAPDGIPTQKTLTLVRDRTTGYYQAPLRIVDKDCAVALAYNSIDEQVIETGCKKLPASGAWTQTDLESGPWTRLKVKLPEAAENLERVTDIHAFRLVAIGDSLTQGVQHGTVVHQDQRYSYPQQLSDQINEYLKQTYGQQVVFKQAMIAEPGIGQPPLSNPHGPGANPDLPFPMPGRLNHTVQPVNNLGLSGARVAHLHTAKDAAWPAYEAREKRRDPQKRRYSGPVFNPKEPKAVWRYVLAPPDMTTPRTPRTAVEQACDLEPSLLVILIGNNDALNAPVSSDMDELTPAEDFIARYDALIQAVLECTEGRSDIVIGALPDVATIPHLRNLGDFVGAMPFTLPVGGDRFSRWFERIYLSEFDRDGRCHGYTSSSGTCLKAEASGAKIGIGTILKGKGAIGQLVTLVGQSKLMREVFGDKPLTLRSDLVMHPDMLDVVQARVDAFNGHLRSWATRKGWPVMEVGELFRDRTSPATIAGRDKLNGLFTGTPRDEALEEEPFRRGLGNTMLGWDGVHPNSAGYSLAANEVVRTLNLKLASQDYGGLERGSVLQPVPPVRIKDLLIQNYLNLRLSRIYEWRVEHAE